MLLGRRVNCERGDLTNKLSKIFLTKICNDLKLICAHGRTPNVCGQNWTWENSVFQSDIRGFTHHGNHLCNSNSLELSQVNTLRRRSILTNWRDVTHRPCAWSTRKRQLQTLREVGQLYGRGWRCQERKLVKWQLRMRKKKHFILTELICQNGILTRKRFIWNQIGI